MAPEPAHTGPFTCCPGMSRQHSARPHTESLGLTDQLSDPFGRNYTHRCPLLSATDNRQARHCVTCLFRPKGLQQTAFLLTCLFPVPGIRFPVAVFDFRRIALSAAWVDGLTVRMTRLQRPTDVTTFHRQGVRNCELLKAWERMKPPLWPSGQSS
jgi:hypothetical protein